MRDTDRRKQARRYQQALSGRVPRALELFGGLQPPPIPVQETRASAEQMRL